MWSIAVYSKAWLLLWNTGSSLSLREGGSSLPSGSRRWRTLLHGMGSISHRFTMPTDHWRTDLMSDGTVERMSPWAMTGLANCGWPAERKPSSHGFESVRARFTSQDNYS